ncbi:MAG: phage terminase large subunit [Ethanoligenens sp.]
MRDKQRDNLMRLSEMVDAGRKKRRRAAQVKPADINRARADFFTFCYDLAPAFYKSDRAYLVRLCADMQAFLESDDQVLIINLPPRHGKSRTAGLFAQWVFGRRPGEKIMTGSYNEKLSTTFAKTVRNGIAEAKADPDAVVYTDIFPGTRIRRGDAAANLWALEGQYASYLATSPTGTATGFGASLLIIDDLIKNAYEANNAMVLDAHWDWFTNTMLSRLEEGGKIILIMTRWATGDLAGRAIKYFTQEHWKLRVISMKAVQADGSMLCPAVLSRESYGKKAALMGADIAAANYQQEPIDLKGRLYSSFKTYAQLPTSGGQSLITERMAYVDTADTGADSLCAIIWGVYNHAAYILDIYFTKSPMEITEPELAKRLMANNVARARIESNNGGKGFARAVIRELEDTLHCYKTQVRWFTQTKNKEARILTGAPWIMEHVYFPVNWRDRWPEYYAAMYEYQREGKNAHDDAPDATTGVAETMGGM